MDSVLDACRAHLERNRDLCERLWVAVALLGIALTWSVPSRWDWIVR